MSSASKSTMPLVMTAMLFRVFRNHSAYNAGVGGIVWYAFHFTSGIFVPGLHGTNRCPSAEPARASS